MNIKSNNYGPSFTAIKYGNSFHLLKKETINAISEALPEIKKMSENYNVTLDSFENKLLIKVRKKAFSLKEMVKNYLTDYLIENQLHNHPTKKEEIILQVKNAIGTHKAITEKANELRK